MRIVWEWCLSRVRSTPMLKSEALRTELREWAEINALSFEMERLVNLSARTSRLKPGSRDSVDAAEAAAAATRRYNQALSARR